MSFPVIWHQSGKKKAAAVVLIYDTFTDTENKRLNLHTISPTNLPATSWTEQGTAEFIINASNQAAKSGSSIGFATVNAGDADVTIEVDAQGKDTGAGQYARDFGIVARYTDENNHWTITINTLGDVFRITEVNGGVITTRATASVALAQSTPYALKVVLSGSTITATIDGGNQISYASATLNQTTTVHGLRAYTSASTIFDNFKVTSE